MLTTAAVTCDTTASTIDMAAAASRPIMELRVVVQTRSKVNILTMVIVGASMVRRLLKKMQIGQKVAKENANPRSVQ